MPWALELGNYLPAGKVMPAGVLKSGEPGGHGPSLFPMCPTVSVNSIGLGCWDLLGLEWTGSLRRRAGVSHGDDPKVRP